VSRILVVEDEQHLAEGLRFNLEVDGHDVTLAPDGDTALEHLTAKRGGFDLVVLDVMLPGRDGFEVAATLRRRGDFVPILMLTARGRADDVLQGFESGADDYLAKPFELAILLARVRGLLRRSAWARHTAAPAHVGPLAGEATPVLEPRAVLAFAGNTLDLDALELRVAGGGAYHLTLMEADLLRYLVENAGRAVSRKAILEQVWSLHEDTDTRAIDNFIVRLRRYLGEEADRPRHLLTVRGVGYKFIAEPDIPPPVPRRAG
jgi:DNA-binding response OmpR family regulator